MIPENYLARLVLPLVFVLVVLHLTGRAQGTAFSYHGRLNGGGLSNTPVSSLQGLSYFGTTNMGGHFSNPISTGGSSPGRLLQSALIGSTPSFNDNSLSLASTAYVDAEISDSQKTRQFTMVTFPWTNATARALSDPELAVWVPANSYVHIRGVFYTEALDNWRGGSGHGGVGVSYFFRPGANPNLNWKLEVWTTVGTSTNLCEEIDYQDKRLSGGGILSTPVRFGGVSNQLVYYVFHLDGIVFNATPACSFTPLWSLVLPGSYMAVLPGSYLESTQLRYPLSSRLAFDNLTTNATAVVVNDGRWNGFPNFFTSPDGATKGCAYIEGPYADSDNRNASRCRYLYPSATSWSQAQAIPGFSSASFNAESLVQQIANVGGSNYVYAIQYQENWPSTGGKNLYGVGQGTWQGSKMLWSSPHFLPLPAGMGWAFATTVCLAPNGDVLLGYYSGTKGSFASQNTGYFRSSDGGKTWSGPTAISGFTAQEPMFAVKGRDIYLFARDATTRVSHDSGTNWTFLGRWTGLTRYLACQPTVTSGGDGKWHLIYRSGTTTDASIREAESDDGHAWTNDSLLWNGWEFYGSLVPTATGFEGVYGGGTSTNYNTVPRVSQVNYVTGP